MQFRLSTFLLAMAVFGTSLSLAGPWGIALALYVLLLVALTRACLSGCGGIVGASLIWLVGIGLPVFLMPMVESAGPAARRAACANNLKQIALGLLQYHDTFGCLPPPYVPDKNGKPMHSWRVLVLPYLQYCGWYGYYSFDEPWNGSNNSKLASVGEVSVYICPGNRISPSQAPNATSYLAVTGPGTAWSSDKPSRPGPRRIVNDRRVLLVEVENSGINWMEPKDLTVDQAIAGLTCRSGPRISSGHDARLANAVLADGELVELPTDLSPELLRIALTEDISHLYKRIPRARIEEMRFDYYPYPWFRLVAWIASVAILLVHGIRYDNQRKKQEKIATAGE